MICIYIYITTSSDMLAWSNSYLYDAVTSRHKYIVIYH